MAAQQLLNFLLLKDLNFKRIFRLIRLIILDLNNPPTILWLDKNKFFQYLPKTNNKILFFYEIFKQLIFWFKKIFIIKKFMKYKRKNNLPFFLFFKASIVNNFSFKEVNFWYKNKITTWNKLVELKPESLTKSIHFINRKVYIDQCIKSIKILQNKAELLNIIPKQYRPSFQLLEDNPIKIKNDFRLSLNKDGLILKPNFGSRTRNIYHIYEKDKAIKIKKLFSRNSEILTSIKNFFKLINFIRMFKKKNNIDEKLIIMPYLRHSNYLPKSNYPIVFRAISESNLKTKEVFLKEIWIELFDKNNQVNFINDDKLVFNPNNPLKLIEELEEEFNYNFDDGELNKSFQKITKASLELHSLLPPIDQVAWDWIHTEKQLILLEGNSNFSLNPLKYFQINKKELNYK